MSSRNKRKLPIKKGKASPGAKQKISAYGMKSVIKKNAKIKKQIEKSSKETRKTKNGKEYFITSDGYDQDGNFVG